MVIQGGNDLGNLGVEQPPGLESGKEHQPPKISKFDGTGLNVGSTSFRGVATETLRLVDLPPLPSEASAIQFGDWLAMLDPLMADISCSRGEWRQRIMETVRKSYEAWSTEDPLGRLRLKVEIPKNASAWPQRKGHWRCSYNHCRKSFELRWWRLGN